MIATVNCAYRFHCFHRRGQCAQELIAALSAAATTISEKRKRRVLVRRTDVHVSLADLALPLVYHSLTSTIVVQPGIGECTDPSLCSSRALKYVHDHSVYNVRATHTGTDRDADVHSCRVVVTVHM